MMVDCLVSLWLKVLACIEEKNINLVVKVLEIFNEVVRTGIVKALVAVGYCQEGE